MNSAILTDEELENITGYQQATKQLQVLHGRGFLRAWINRHGKVVLERPHFEVVSRGELRDTGKRANLAVFQQRAA